MNIVSIYMREKTKIYDDVLGIWTITFSETCIQKNKYDFLK